MDYDYGVSGPYRTADEHYTHDTGLAYEPTILRPAKHRCEKAGLEFLDLGTRAPQAGNLYHCAATELQSRASRKAKQIDAAGGDVLAQLARQHLKSAGCDLCKQLLVEKVHLPQIGFVRMPRCAGTVPDRRSAMRVPADTLALDELDARLRGL